MREALSVAGASDASVPAATVPPCGPRDPRPTMPARAAERRLAFVAGRQCHPSEPLAGRCHELTPIGRASFSELAHSARVGREEGARARLEAIGAPARHAAEHRHVEHVTARAGNDASPVASRSAIARSTCSASTALSSASSSAALSATSRIRSAKSCHASRDSPALSSSAPTTSWALASAARRTIVAPSTPRSAGERSQRSRPGRPSSGRPATGVALPCRPPPPRLALAAAGPSARHRILLAVPPEPWQRSSPAWRPVDRRPSPHETPAVP